MTDGVPNLRGGAGTWVAFILGPLLGAIMAGGGILWTMAKQPDRGEFNEVRSLVYRMQLDTAIHSNRLGGVEKSVDAINTKIDRVLEAQRKGDRDRR